MKLLFISNMIAPFILKNNCRLGRIIAFILMLLTCVSIFFAVAPSAEGQAAEAVVVADKVATAVQNKDINYVIALSGALSIGFSFWLVKQIIAEKNKQIESNQKNQDEHNKLMIAQIEALGKLTQEIKDRPCWYPHQRSQGS